MGDSKNSLLAGHQRPSQERFLDEGLDAFECGPV
jgi:hypothetical protein